MNAPHSVTCPEGRTLDHQGQTHKRGQVVERFRCHYRDCPVRHQCTRDPKGRQIEVWPHHSQVQAMRQRLEQPALQEQWQQRSQISERRFAQLKQHDGFRRWTVWGLESVRTQWSMLCSTLNLRILYGRWKSGLDRGLNQAEVSVKELKDLFQRRCAHFQLHQWQRPVEFGLAKIKLGAGPAHRLLALPI